MTRQNMISALLTALVVAGIAYAGQLTGIGGVYWSSNVAVTSTAQCVTDTTDAGTLCTLFPAGVAKSQWYNMVVTKASYGLTGAVTACFTQSPETDVASGAISSDAVTGVGGGACHVLTTAADRHDERPWATDIRSRPGGRAGICRGSVYSAGDRLYPSCGDGDDCTAMGLTSTDATCDAEAAWTQDQRDYQGVYLIVHSAAGQTIHVSKERIQER